MKCLHACGHKDAGLLVLRLAAGAIFIYAGYGKLFGSIGMDAFTGMVEGIGFPAPAFFAYCAAITEFFGGMALILGLGTPIVAALLAFVMLIAFSMVNGAGFPAGELDVALFAIVLALGAIGPGSWSLDRHICEKFCKKGDTCCSTNKDGCCT